MVCDVVEMAVGVGLAWARRDGVGVPVAAVVPVAVALPSALSVLAALVSMNVAVLSSAVPVVAFVLASSSALPVSLLAASACACCPAVARGWHGLCDGRHGHRRAGHGRARDRAEQVLKGSFHSGASR